MKKTKNKKAFIIFLFILLILSLFLSVLLGSENINLFKAFSDISHGVKSSDALIFLYVRVPRAVAGLLAGSSLALAGVIIQSVLNNSLASPSTIGVNSGSGLMVCLFSAFCPSLFFLTPFVSLLGAFLGCLLVLYIGERTSSSRITLVLAGLAISAIFNALIDAVLTFYPDSLNGYSDFRIGGLFSVSFNKILPSIPLIVIATILSLLLHNELDILLLGKEEAQSLGLKASKYRVLFLALSAVLSGSAISFTGLIGFIGLIVPHIMREKVGEDSLVLMVSSILGGGILLLISDLLSRLIFAPYELPVGIMTALIGGPFFIYLLKKRGKNN